jgi:deazaflavin-dependent oxidoreductase (nitroreductase family)
MSTTAVIEALADAQVLDLITIGRVSGQPRQIEIWFIAHEGKLYLFAETGQRAGWVKNIKRNPAIRVNLRGHQFAGSARIVDPAAEPELCRALRAIQLAKYQWDGGLPVELSVYPASVEP